jgi:hypothetical protein
MKKISLFILLIIIFGLTGCKNINTNNQSNETLENNITDNITENNNLNNTDKEWGVPQRHITLGKRYQISFPVLTGIPQGAGLIAYQPDRTMVMVDPEYGDSPEVHSIEEVFSAYYEQRNLMFTFYYSFQFKNPTYTVRSQEMIKINNYDMCKYVGQMKFTKENIDIKYNFVAYSTQLTNGSYIYCMAVDETDEQSQGKTIESHAYNMALSLKEED